MSEYVTIIENMEGGSDEYEASRETLWKLKEEIMRLGFCNNPGNDAFGNHPNPRSMDEVHNVFVPAIYDEMPKVLEERAAHSGVIGLKYISSLIAEFDNSL